MNRGIHAAPPALPMAFCASLWALSPSLDVSQYGHASWTPRDGSFKGMIYSMAQTADGYLWLGTDFGLFRFDGIRGVPWQSPGGEKLRGKTVLALLASRDGSLWIATDKELVSWNGGLTRHGELDGFAVQDLIQDREGVIWAAGTAVTARNGKLCAIRGGNPECFEGDAGSGPFGPALYRLYEDRSGGIWFVSSRGFWRWKDGAGKLYPMDPALDLQSVIEGEDGKIWIATRFGIRKLTGDRFEDLPLLGKRQFRAQQMFRDRDGGLWIGTIGLGLVHIYRGRRDIFGRADGLSGDDVLRIVEDREGTCGSQPAAAWIASAASLRPDSLRNRVSPAI